MKTVWKVCLFFLVAAIASTQQQQPFQAQQADCKVNFNISVVSAGANVPANAPGTSVIIDNGGTAASGFPGCQMWKVTYKSAGFTAPFELHFQSAADAGDTPGTWGDFAGTLDAGSINPMTATDQSFLSGTGFYPWLRMNLRVATGLGVVRGTLYGFKSRPGSASTGSGTVSPGTAHQTAIYPASGSTVAGRGPGVAGNVWTSNGPAVDPSFQPSAALHAINFVIDGGGAAIAPGAVGVFPSANFNCTINAAMISADVSGSITVDVWKLNAAIPSAGNIISAASPVTLAASQLNQASSLTGWTLAVVPNDVFGFSVASSSTVTRVVGQLWCS